MQTAIDELPWHVPLISLSQGNGQDLYHCFQALEVGRVLG
jgi:hypothetical protein